MNRKIYGMLGLAAKSGAIISGGNSCERALRQHGAPLLVLAQDASENTRDRFLKLAGNREIRVKIFGTCDELGKYIGKESRSVLIITDENFAKCLADLMDCALRENGGGDIGKNQGL